MSNRASYLIRRGDTFAFRIVIPADLRRAFGVRELVRSLHTQSRITAKPLALDLASKALQLFTRIRAMPDENADGLRSNFGFEFSFDTSGRPKLEFTDVKPEDVPAISELGQKFGLVAQAAPLAAAVAPTKPTPKLSTVIDEFLEDESARGIESMMKKHEAVLPMFLEIVGDKPVGSLRQSDITDFFKLLHCLPPRWKSLEVAPLVRTEFRDS